jgi:hypothetical protein
MDEAALIDEATPRMFFSHFPLLKPDVTRYPDLLSCWNDFHIPLTS